MEHMLFKGTPDLDALGIAQAFEGIGAQENAATGEEYTVLYARFLPEHLEKALDVMGDMVLRPTFADLEREREVIVEEIKMYEDRPDQMADEYLSGLIFHGDPLGRPIIGSAETVRGVDHETLKSFHQNTYTASNVFVVGAGKLDPDELEAMVEAKLGGLPAGEPVQQERAPRHAAEPRPLQVQGDRAVPRLPRLSRHPCQERGPLRDGRPKQRAGVAA
jgi:predicted Zn-dependent peptidase